MSGNRLTRWFMRLGAIGTLAAMLMASVSPAYAQTPGVFDWAALGLADEAGVPATNVLTSAGVTTTVTHSTVINGAAFAPSNPNGFLTYETSARGTIAETAELGVNNVSIDPNDEVVVDITFSEPVQSVEFTLTDVDLGGGFHDFVEVFVDTGAGLVNARDSGFDSLGGAGVAEDDETFGEGWEGIFGVGNASPAANVIFDFGNTVVSAVQIRYFSGDDFTQPDPGTQIIGLSDISYATIPNAVDLALTKTVDNQFPTVGATINYTLTLQNDGFINATGVEVLDLLPSGVTYVSDNGAGAYNPSTGLWTVPGVLAPGASISLRITASVNPAGARSNFAEVTAANETDVDSTPGNGATNPGEDDSDVIAISVSGGGGGTPPLLSCGPSAVLFDWDTNAWNTGDLTDSFTAGGQAIDFAFSGDTGFLINVGPGQSPVLSNLLEGGITPAEQSLLYVANFSNRTQAITLSGDIGTPGVGVAELQFTIFDVDTGPAGGDFVDQVTATGFLNGTPVAPILTAGTANTVAGSVATGIADSASPNADGNLVVTFTSPVDSFVVTYGSAPAAPLDPLQQGISLHDLTFCQPQTPNLEAVKTAAVFDPASAGLLALPGNDVVYTIRVTNRGDGVVDTNSVFLVDLMPPEVEFYNDDFNDGAPGTSVVEFNQSGSGITFNEATDLRFSDAAIEPADFDDCTFNPSTGYDARVTFICFNPKGAFQPGAPDPFIEFNFRARIE